MARSVASSIHRVAVDGGALEVLVGGPGASVAIAAAHPVDAMSAATVSLLSGAADAQVACVNPRGAGGSSPLRPGDDTLEAMADELDAVRRGLGLHRWVLWGMSGGGFLSLVYAHRHPASLAGLILESAGPCFREAMRDPSQIASPFHPAYRDRLEAAGLLPSPSQPCRDEPDADWEEVADLGLVYRVRGGPALLVLLPALVSARMRQMMPALWSYDARPWLSEIRTPTLVIGGTDDRVAPLAQVRLVHEGVAGAELVVIDGAGHVPVAEGRPEVAAAVRRFLAERVGSVR